MPLTGPEVLLYEKKDRIVTITLNRPERMNALTIELFDRLDEAWQQFNADDDAFVAILTAAGDRAFCVGLDMKDQAERKAEAIVNAYPKEVPEASPFTPKRIPAPPTKKESPPLQLEAPAVGEAELHLQGIVQGEIKAALINDMIVHVDSVIEGYRVINIKTDSVVLKKGRRVKILKLENSLY